MGAIDVGVGHDDDTFVPQAVGVAILAHSAAEREREVGDFLIGANLVGAGAGDVHSLAADRQDRLRRAVARLLGRSEEQRLGKECVSTGCSGWGWYHYKQKKIINSSTEL